MKIYNKRYKGASYLQINCSYEDYGQLRDAIQFALWAAMEFDAAGPGEAENIKKAAANIAKPWIREK